MYHYYTSYCIWYSSAKVILQYYHYTTSRAPSPLDRLQRNHRDGRRGSLLTTWDLPSARLLRVPGASLGRRPTEEEW